MATKRQKAQTGKKSGVVVAVTPALKAEQKKFVDDLVVRGDAVPAGNQLPPGATHEIVQQPGSSQQQVVRRRFSLT